MRSVLLAEDDGNLGFLLRENLQARGFEVALCKDGEEAFNTFEQYEFSICIIDVMMPKKDGFELVREIRRVNDHVPIIFLTARNKDEDKIKAFETGCDDYVTKPFSARELVLRIDAILKRTGGKEKISQQNREREIGEKYIFNYQHRLLKCNGVPVKLSAKEADLLNILINNKNEVVSRNKILLNVWGSDDYFSARSMDVYLTRIRKLIREDDSLELQNVHGIGFKLVDSRA